MENTIRIKIMNSRAFGLLRELEKLNLISILPGKKKNKPKLKSDKFYGIISAERGDEMQKELKKNRESWRAGNS